MLIMLDLIPVLEEFQREVQSKKVEWQCSFDDFPQKSKVKSLLSLFTILSALIWIFTEL